MKMIWDEKVRVATVRMKDFERSPDRVSTWQFVYMQQVRALWDKRSGILGVFCSVIRRFPGSSEEEIVHLMAPVLKVVETREDAIRRVLREIDRWMEDIFADALIIPRDDDRTDEQVMEEYFAEVERDRQVMEKLASAEQPAGV